MKFWVLIFAVATTSCATKEIKECADQDTAVVLQILLETIDLKFEPLNSIKKITEEYAQRRRSKVEFNQELAAINKKIQQINRAGRIAISNFVSDHPECNNDEIRKFLND